MGEVFGRASRWPATSRKKRPSNTRRGKRGRSGVSANNPRALLDSEPTKAGDLFSLALRWGSFLCHKWGKFFGVDKYARSPAELCYDVPRLLQMFESLGENWIRSRTTRGRPGTLWALPGSQRVTLRASRRCCAPVFIPWASPKICGWGRVGPSRRLPGQVRVISHTSGTRSATPAMIMRRSPDWGRSRRCAT